MPHFFLFVFPEMPHFSHFQNQKGNVRFWGISGKIAYALTCKIPPSKAFWGISWYPPYYNNKPVLASNENPAAGLVVPILAPNPPKAEPIPFDAESDDVTDDVTPRRFAFIITLCLRVDSFALKRLNESFSGWPLVLRPNFKGRVTSSSEWIYRKSLADTLRLKLRSRP